MLFVSYIDAYYCHCLTCIILDNFSRCRWISNSEEHLIFVKYDWSMLNILDTQKGTLTLKIHSFLKRQKIGNLLNFCS